MTVYCDVWSKMHIYWVWLVFKLPAVEGLTCDLEAVVFGVLQ